VIRLLIGVIGHRWKCCSVLEIPATILLPTGLSAFGIQAPLNGAAPGSGGTAGFLHHECIGKAHPEPVKGKAAVAQLRSFILGRNHHCRPQFRHEAIALPLRERGRSLDVESNFGPGVGPIGMLPTGAAARTKAPLEFGHSDDNTRRHPQSLLRFVHHPSLGVVALYASAMTGQEWISTFAAELGLEPLTEADIEALLDLAGVAAHASERLAAPLTCYLAAKAGISPTDALARARAMAEA
jgi:hypothetical protein